MADKKERARAFYNVIESLAPDKKCPLCLERTTSEVDHYLPKDKFARFAIVPANLVPICHECNQKKLAKVAQSAEDQPLHPYFDNLGGTGWLTAEMSRAPKAPVVFSIAPDPLWSHALTRRVQNHFRDLELGDLWSASAGTWLSSNRSYLRKLYRQGNAYTVRSTLLDFADSYEDAGAEPWRVVAMRTWARSRWFCSCKW